MVQQKIDNRFKVIILGESNVGKTCLMRKFTREEFRRSLMSTIGIDTKSKVINMQNKNILLNIWDTAGQERFYSITRSYYRNADGILLIFDLDDERTFSCLDKWFNDIVKETEGAPILLVGNKRDMVNDKQYDQMKDKYHKKALLMGTKFIATSAKTGENVNKIFEDMAELLLNSENKKYCDNINNEGYTRKINRNCCW